MLNIKDYEKQKKDYKKLNDLSSEKIYNYFTSEQFSVIQQYYEYYTKYLFKTLRGSLRLNVSPSKIENLIQLKGDGDWEFAGMIDCLKKGAATCELNHPLRYVYFARNINNGQILRFGYRCVSDFFDLDDKGVQDLLKVKDEMFSELKELVAIKEKNLFFEHYTYDCQELGGLILSVKNIDKLLKVGPDMEKVVEFLRVKLPLPKSLLGIILNGSSKIGVDNALNDLAFYGIDTDLLNELKDSEITLISKMFINSEINIKESLKKGKLDKKSDFYNFKTINDLEIAINEWSNRLPRLLKVQDYFKRQGVKDWSELYKYAVSIGFKNTNSDFYNGLLLVMFFDTNISISENYYFPKEYTYKWHKLNETIESSFDEIIDYLATRDFIMNLKELIDLLSGRNKILEEENQRIEMMMQYLKEHLPMEKYNSLGGINGVSNIILQKKLDYDSMTSRQQNFVESVYKSMKSMDKREEAINNPQIDSDINNRYSLSEKSEVLSKIQKLQEPCILDMLMKESKRTVDIMETVMATHFVSDKQLKYIDAAYSKYVLSEVSINTDSNTLDVGKNENRKWNLIERPDVVEKIMAIKSSSRYDGLYETVKNILDNILKYKIISNKQIETVEKTYKRCCDGD